MNNSSARFRYVIAGILVLSSSTAATAPQNDVMLALDNFGSMRKNDPIFLARGANESFILSEPATPPPEPVAPPPVKTLEAIVITPLPDDSVTFQPLPAPQDPAELLASLSGDDRETLEEISEQTGIPIEQLALELVGPDTGSTAEQSESGGAIITYPEDQITEAGQRIHYAILAASAASLLLLVGFIVWLFMRRRKSSRASVTTATLAATSTMDLAASIDDQVGFEEEDTVIWDGEPSDADGMFGSIADVALGEDPAAALAYANSDVFDGSGNTGISKGDPGDETIGEDLATVVVTSLAEVSELPQEQDYLGATANNPIDEDEEDLGVEINLDAVGEAGQDEDFDAEASAFFEDITVGPMLDDDMFDIAGGTDTNDDSTLDAKLYQAGTILDSTAIDLEATTGDALREPHDPNDLTMEQFIETDSFDTPATVPPVDPRVEAESQHCPPQGISRGRVRATVDLGSTRDAIMNTALLAAKVEVMNEDMVVLPEQVPNNEDDTFSSDTVVLPGRQAKDKKPDDEGELEDPTVVK